MKMFKGLIMKVDLEDIKLSQREIDVDKVSGNILFSAIAVLVILISLASVKAFASLKQIPYDLIKSGEIFYKADNGTFSKALALDTKVSMNITGIINRVRVTQTFKNEDDFWTEGTYLFPLPDDSAVDYMEMKIGDSIIVGEIKEKVEAKKIYEEAKKEGKKVSIVSQERPNLFTAKVANIPPKGEITVSIEYQQKVSYDNQKFSINFPMVAAQRYLPASKTGTLKDPKDINLIQAVEDTTNPINRPVDLNIKLNPGFEVKDINSLFHKINVNQMNNDAYEITFKNVEQANKDFTLEWSAKQTNDVQAKLFSQEKNGRNFGLLMITPPHEAYITKQDINREVIFIIDSSGSMGGPSMTQASLALELAINRLKIGDKFNIIDYDSSYNLLFKTAQPVNNLTTAMAAGFIDKINADGGTEALAPIDYALKSTNKDSKDYLRQVVFITDGELSNEEEIFRTVKQNINDSKLFTVAIGSAPNTFFLKKLAQYGQGTFAHIGNQNQVTKQMEVFFRKLENPSLTNISISNVDIKLSDLYFGETVFYSFESKDIPSTVYLNAKKLDANYFQKIDVIKQDDASGLDKLWAKQTIDNLMSKYYTSYDEQREQLKDLVTNIALEYNLVSNFTSLIAVDKTPSRVKEEILKSKQVQTKIPDGWKMYDANVPQTATNYKMLLVIGSMLLLLAYVLKKLEDSSNEEI